MTPQDLGQRAGEFAKHYVALVEALQREGVPEAMAREEARSTAICVVFWGDGSREEGDVCPLCGRGDSEGDL